MSSLKNIKDRIQSVQSTRQVTASMKIVALARLKKLHAEFLKTQAYADEMNRMIRRLIRSAGKRQEDLLWQGSDKILPLPSLLKGNGKDNRYIVAVITSDDGLSGSAGLSVVQQAKKVIDYLQSAHKKVTVIAFGTRGAAILKRFYPQMDITVLRRQLVHGKHPFLDAERLSGDIIQAFDHDKFDVCLLVYLQFKSVVVQRPTVEQLIPNKLFATENPWAFLMNEDADYIERDALGQKQIRLRRSPFLQVLGSKIVSPFGALSEADFQEGKRLPEAYDYEPSDIHLLDMILPQYLVAYMYRVLSSADISDNASRLMAMDNATRNAGDMIQSLTKQYRRQRQSKITTDIAESFEGVG